MSNVISVDQWTELAVHTIKLPSGAVVKIKLPDVPEMLVAGEFPNSLREVGMSQLTDSPSDVTKLSPEQLKEILEFNRHVVAATLVEPKLSPDQVDLIPQEDKDLIAALARRDTAIDEYEVGESGA